MATAVPANGLEQILDRLEGCRGRQLVETLVAVEPLPPGFDRPRVTAEPNPDIQPTRFVLDDMKV